MGRYFTDNDKKTMFLKSKGMCQICGIELRKGWHADHIIPYSKGGETEINNGQALCPKCNLTKSNFQTNNLTRMELKPRKWQLEAMKKVETQLNKKAKKSLIVAGVGSGKTTFSQMITKKLFDDKEFDNVIIISPTENIKYNWAATFEENFNIPIDFKYNFKYHFNQDYKGISITYKSIESDINSEVLANRIGDKTLIIVDEVHHAGDNKSWGLGLNKVGQKAGFILLLSGTPTRSDNSKIPFVDYDYEDSTKMYHLKSDYEYTYAQSVEDLVCCPVKFTTIGSNFETIFGDKKQLDRTVDKYNAGYNLNLLLDVKGKDESCYVYQTWIKGNEMLNAINDSTNRDMAGLVICNTIDDAEGLFELISKNYGSDFVEIVTSADKEASKKINRFKNSNKSWIISVNMVSEGVDIPRIRTIVYMTNYSTMLYFMQVLGRGVRNYDNTLYNSIDSCQMIIPDYEPLINNAEMVEESIRHIFEEIEINKKNDDKKKRESIELFDGVISATSENNGAIFKGDHIDNATKIMVENLANINNTSFDTVLSIMNGLKIMNAPIQKNIQDTPFVSMTDRKKMIKAQIHKVVGKIAYEFDLDFKEIHYTLNPFGKNTNELTYEELRDKLQRATDNYNRLKNDQ